MSNYKIEKAYLLFDQLYINKKMAYQVEDENGSHKDQVTEGYYIFESNELEALQSNEVINIPCNYDSFYDTFENAIEVSILEGLDIATFEGTLNVLWEDEEETESVKVYSFIDEENDKIYSVLENDKIIFGATTFRGLIHEIERVGHEVI